MAAACSECGTELPARGRRRGGETLTCSPRCRYLRARRRTNRAEHVPAEPLIRLAGTQAELAACVGVDRRTAARWAREGIPVYVADQVAVSVFGCHPAELWGDWVERASHG